MKFKIFALVISVLVVGVLASCQTSEDDGLVEEPAPVAGQSIEISDEPVEETTKPEEAAGEDDGFGSKGAFENVNASIEQMLVYAIQDEYFARSEYDYFINELDAGTPFTNIIKSEETHIAMLVPLFEAYDLAIPEDESNMHLISVETITQALETCVEAEINNIAMYNRFLEGELPDDIRDAFTKLRDASVKHLEAFERKLSRVI